MSIKIKSDNISNNNTNSTSSQSHQRRKSVKDLHKMFENAQQSQSDLSPVVRPSKKMHGRKVSMIQSQFGNLNDNKEKSTLSQSTTVAKEIQQMQGTGTVKRKTEKMEELIKKQLESYIENSPQIKLVKETLKTLINSGLKKSEDYKKELDQLERFNPILAKTIYPKYIELRDKLIEDSVDFKNSDFMEKLVYRYAIFLEYYEARYEACINEFVRYGYVEGFIRKKHEQNQQEEKIYRENRDKTKEIGKDYPSFVDSRSPSEYIAKQKDNIISWAKEYNEMDNDAAELQYNDFYNETLNKENNELKEVRVINWEDAEKRNYLSYSLKIGNEIGALKELSLNYAADAAELIKTLKDKGGKYTSYAKFMSDDLYLAEQKLEDLLTLTPKYKLNKRITFTDKKTGKKVVKKLIVRMRPKPERKEPPKNETKPKISFSKEELIVADCMDRPTIPALKKKS